MKKTRQPIPTYPFPIVRLGLVQDASPNQGKQIVTTSLEAMAAARLLYPPDDIAYRETFGIFMLNRRNRITGSMILSQGGQTGTVVDKKMIAQAAILSHATSVILFHNHPSGNLKPSEGDIKITKETKEALALFDIKVLDHIILIPEEENNYFSFADEGML